MRLKNKIRAVVRPPLPLRSLNYGHKFTQRYRQAGFMTIFHVPNLIQSNKLNITTIFLIVYIITHLVYYFRQKRVLWATL